jgi:calpain-7
LWYLFCIFRFQFFLTLFSINQATNEDKLNNYGAAQLLYIEAVNTFLECLTRETNEKSKKLLQDKIAEFTTRTNELEKLKSSNTGNGDGSGASGDVVGGKGRGGGGNADLTRADFVLEQALVLDEGGKPQEALALYLDSIELYLIAKDSLPASSDQVSSIGKRITDVLERAETIKREATLASLPDAPVMNMKTSKSAPNPPPTGPKEPSNHLHPSTSMSTPSTTSTTDFVPTTTHKMSGESLLTKLELDILRRSSHINSKLYLPWNDVDYNEKFVFPTRYTDPDGLLPLSKEQGFKFANWKRPYLITPETPVMISVVSAYSIRQDCIGDCSFVSSLCIGAAYERRFNKQLITSIIFPQNRKGQPVYNPR